MIQHIHDRIQAVTMLLDKIEPTENLRNLVDDYKRYILIWFISKSVILIRL
jgi:hypothetical protein